MGKKSKVLVIGGTGHLGKFMVEASVVAGHETFALVRHEGLSNPSKATIVDRFRELSVSLVSGDVLDHESLVKAIKQVDVVICTLGTKMTADQLNIIDAIKEAGTVKRFFPSEFGIDGGRTRVLEPVKSSHFAPKVRIRRAVEGAGIPYTYVSANNFDNPILKGMSQFGATTPPRGKVVIIGNGDVKAVYNYEGDVATYTIRAVDDPRTLNKILYIRPPCNTFSFNELVTLWEKKIHNKLERVYMYEDEVLTNIRECGPSLSGFYAMAHAIYVLGDETNFDIDPSFGVEASTLYPDVKCTSVDDYLDRLV